MRWLAVPVLLALAACGQKGNLYLPDDNVDTVPVSTGPTTAAPVNAEPAGAEPGVTAPADGAAAGEDPDRDKPARRN